LSECRPIPRFRLSVAFDDLRAGIDPAGVRDDQCPVLGLQERSPDLARPNDMVPKPLSLWMMTFM